MQLHVPEIGEQLKLTSDWTFNLHWESRNSSLIKHFFGVYDWKLSQQTRPLTLSAGTVLKVSRIYIRQGSAAYSSITFYAAIPVGKKIKNLRFWATLEDCNKIEFEVESEAPVNLEWGIRLYKSGDPNGYAHKGEETLPGPFLEEGNVKWVISTSKKIEVLKVKLEHELEWEHGGNGFHGPYKISWMKNLEWSLYTLQGELLGSWKTATSMKGFAQNWVKDNSQHFL